MKKKMSLTKISNDLMNKTRAGVEFGIHCFCYCACRTEEDSATNDKSNYVAKYVMNQPDKEEPDKHDSGLQFSPI